MSRRWTMAVLGLGVTLSVVAVGCSSDGGPEGPERADDQTAATAQEPGPAEDAGSLPAQEDGPAGVGSIYGGSEPASSDEKGGGGGQKGLSPVMPPDENPGEDDPIPVPPNPSLVGLRIEATEHRITPLDPEPNDEFAWSLDFDGESLISGAPLADDSGGSSGTAYIFRWNGVAFDQVAKLLPDDGSDLDWFGKSVAISGDTAVVGANLDDGPLRGMFFDDDTGSAYVFVREQGAEGEIWTQQAKLRAEPQVEWDEFGFDVEIDGDIIAVAAWHDQEVAYNTGAVHVFRREGDAWVREAKLTPSQGAAVDEFGIDIALSGDTILVGAHLDDGRADDAGAAYVYRRVDDVWEEEAVLRAPDARAFDQFGWSVALDADTAVIGAPFHDGAALDGGTAYVFQRDPANRWSAVAKLLPSDPFGGAWFGRAVGVAGGYAVIGAPRYDHITLDGIANELFNIGVSYVFQEQDAHWLEIVQLRADDPAEGDDFGWTIAQDDAVAIVGAWLADTEAGPDAGLAYSYVLP